jgi:hypothetical protein
MRQLTAFFLFISLSMGTAFAQSAYEFTTPPGWQRSDANGIVVLKPGGDTQNSMVVMLFPVISMAGGVDVLFNTYRTSLEQSLQLRPTQVTQPVRGQANGAENVMLAGIYATSNGPRTVVFFGRAENGAFGIGMFLSTNVDNISANIQQISVLFNSLHLSANAAQIAAANAGGEPQQPNPSSPANGAQQSSPPAQADQQQTQTNPAQMPTNPPQAQTGKPTLEELIEKNKKPTSGPNGLNHYSSW